jgi:hypothetical protein
VVATGSPVPTFTGSPGVGTPTRTGSPGGGTPVATATRTPAGPTRTPGGGGSDEDDGCAVVAPQASAWDLLVLPALLIGWRAFSRRRRS